MSEHRDSGTLGKFASKLGSANNLVLRVASAAVLGPLVLNERNDIIVTAANGPTRTFHVAAGLFFIENNKIVEWTDYVIQ